MAILTPDMIEFLGEGVAHQVGGCTRDGTPVLCRGLAGTVEGDQVVVVLSKISGHEVLEAVRDTGWVAVNFTLPANYQSLHVKGRDAAVAVGGAHYRALVEARHRAYRDQLAPFGFPPALTTAWYDVPDPELMTIRFVPVGAWDQTPGPGAGNALELK